MKRKEERKLVKRKGEKLKEVKKLFPKLANMHRLKEQLRNSFEKSDSELIGLLNLSDWLRDADPRFPQQFCDYN